ncbi:hypothetical protein D3H65_26860 [Paraflavitalea soli]|uniref:Uncharacterized protein n=1 Tax=Paraflavitalea soli TaxID=2315862 RepID=A0A3B7MVZ6_9BACT|nr:hypothetical protein D3H65_26860 [Paraflavitalea soli]
MLLLDHVKELQTTFLLFTTAVGRGLAGSLFLLSQAKSPRQWQIDTANLQRPALLLFKNGLGLSNTWDERHMSWDEQLFLLQNTWRVGTRKGNTQDERHMFRDE